MTFLERRNASRKRTMSSLLLKGAATVITDGKSTYIVDRGCTGMSTAGSRGRALGHTRRYLRICEGRGPDARRRGGSVSEWPRGRARSEDIPAVSMLSGDTVAHIPDAVRGDTRGGGRDRIRTPMGRNMI